MAKKPVVTQEVPYINTAEAAKLLGITERMVRKHITKKDPENRLKAIKIGRPWLITIHDFHEFKRTWKQRKKS
jgi:excisionase family DNA binding protein